MLLVTAKSSVHVSQLSVDHPILSIVSTVAPTGPLVSFHFAFPSAANHLCWLRHVCSQAPCSSFMVSFAFQDPFFALQTSFCQRLAAAVAALQVLSPLRSLVAAIDRPAEDGTDAAAATLCTILSSESDSPFTSAPWAMAGAMPVENTFMVSRAPINDLNVLILAFLLVPFQSLMVLTFFAARPLFFPAP